MKANEAFPSKYLKGPDLKTDSGDYRTMTLTIAGEVTTAKFDDGGEQRLISFREIDKQLGLNRTNWQEIMEISGKDDDEDWAGTVIEVYFDKNVMFGGKKVGGIRIRRPGGSSNAAPSGPVPVTSKAGAYLRWKQLRGDDTGPWLAEWGKAIEEVAVVSEKAKDQWGPDEFTMLAELAKPKVIPLPPGGVVIDESSIPF